MTETRRKFTEEFKAAAIERLRNNETVPQLAKEFGINDGILYRWRNKADAVRTKAKVKARKKYTRKANGHAAVISNNTIKMEPFVLDAQMAASVRMIAEVCAANARVLQVLADKLSGPTQYGIGINTER
jgi:transposase-like protein